MTALVDRARWDELMRQAIAASIAGGLIAAMPRPLSVDQALDLHRTVMRRMFGEQRP